MTNYFKKFFRKKSPTYKERDKVDVSCMVCRRSGRTTRIIDKCVQDFFDYNKCEVKDHYLTRESNLRVLRIVLERLRNEHGVRDEDVKVDKNKYTLINLNINSWGTILR
jgi:hypothetical protein